MNVEVEAVSKTFPRQGRLAAATVALHELALTVAEGEMLALVGHSGSGKTSMLRAIAGLEKPDRGKISIGGRVVFDAAAKTDVPTEQWHVGLIFQNYALWPHMTVEENVGYPLARRKVPMPERRKQVAHYLDMVQCGPLAQRYPHQLSGGQQQRVALARALVYEPRVVLFDEPLSNLDAPLRERLRYRIREVQRLLGFTGIYVTHDQTEAFFVADRVALMADGRLLQQGRPREVFQVFGALSLGMSLVL